MTRNIFSVSSSTPIHLIKDSQLISNGRIHLIPFPIKKIQFSSQLTNNYSDEMISNSFHSIDDQLVTLV